MSSLKAVQKLIKKWQSQMENATTAEERREMFEVGSQNIASEFGYPIEVTPKMLTGELSMSDEAIAARQQEMGMGGIMYRGHDANYPPRSNQEMFMSDDMDVAETYADNAGRSGVITPLRHNADNLLEIDAEGQWYEDLSLEPWHVPDLNIGTYLGTLDGTEGIGHAVFEEGKKQGVRFKNIGDDMYGPPEYSDEELLDMGMTREEAEHFNTSTVENIFGSRPGVKIRHADAAYDPKYSGSNIMGNATVPMMGLLATGSAGAGILLNSLFAEAERAKK